jgi:hypothetical protein
MKKSQKIKLCPPPHPINTLYGLNSFYTYFISFPLSSTLYAMSNNWSPDLQMWCDILNTPSSQVPSIPDEFVDASLLHHRFNVSPTLCPRALFQPPSPLSSYPLYPYPPPTAALSTDAPPPYPYSHPPISGSTSLLHHIHTLHHMDIGHIHTFLPQPVVRRVVMLLQHMHTLHLWNIHTLHINLFTLGGENSGGAKNTFQTTQALPRITKRNEWTRGNEKNFVVTNFIISFSLF